MEHQAKLNEKLHDTATRYILFLFVLLQLVYQQISSTTFWNFIQHYLKKNIKFSILQIQIGEGVGDDAEATQHSRITCTILPHSTEHCIVNTLVKIGIGQL